MQEMTTLVSSNMPTTISLRLPPIYICICICIWSHVRCCGTPLQIVSNSTWRRSFTEEESSVIDSVVEMGDSAAGSPLTEKFEIETGALW
jgi:hypothetical protein